MTRDEYNAYQRRRYHRMRWHTTPERRHYTDDELINITAWTDLGIPTHEQGKRLGRSPRAIAQARRRWKIGYEMEEA